MAITRSNLDRAMEEARGMVSAEFKDSGWATIVDTICKLFIKYTNERMKANDSK